MSNDNDKTIIDDELEAVDAKGLTLLAHAVEQCDPEAALSLLREAADTELVYCSDTTDCELPLLFQAVLIHDKKRTPASLQVVSLLLRYGASLVLKGGRSEAERVIDALQGRENEDLIQLFGVSRVIEMKNECENLLQPDVSSISRC